MTKKRRKKKQTNKLIIFIIILIATVIDIFVADPLPWIDEIGLIALSIWYWYQNIRKQ